MARKVILDVDPGIDDAVAVALALCDPRLDVVAVTAVAGNVDAQQATRNVQTIIEQLDPPRWPRLGAASPPDRQPDVDTRHIYGSDGLGESNFAVAELHHQHPSEKLIADVIRGAPQEVTLIALGPLTNVARAFARDPALAEMLTQLIIMGGTVSGPGNVTPAAEFNMYFDPKAARAVFHSSASMLLVPLDVTSQVIWRYDFLEQLPSDASRRGRLLRRILPFAFRSHHLELALEGVHLHDVVALAAAPHPELFVTELMGADVEVAGELTTGTTIFDRRVVRQWRATMEVATEVDAAAVMDYVSRGLKQSEAVD